MCGINGIYNFRPGHTVDEDLLKRMRDVMPHRGPDESGCYVRDNIGFGHRRLSIIDLAGGQQPLCNEDGNVWVTFNGEIFNHNELRDELISKGHKFKTRSDTEVLVHLYEEEGIETPKRLRGQFAFAIWDANRKRVLMARDRLGILPLYYTANRERLAFASELKVLLEDKSIPREIDTHALVDYLTYEYIPAPKTIFQDIQKLPAGNLLVAENGETAVRPYWSIHFEEDNETSEEEFLEKIEAKILEAVKIRLMSEVPLGAFLSGGIDSSLIVALMSKVSEERVKTFSIGFGEAEFDELKYARIIAKQFNTEHHEFVVTPDTRDLLPRLVQQFDEPFADPSAIPTYHVCRMAREHVTVCLSGDGGDEGFAGYTRYKQALNRFERFRAVPTALRSQFFGSIDRLLPSGARGKRQAQLNSARTPAELYALVKGYQHPSRYLPLLLPSVREEVRFRGPFELIERLYESSSAEDYVSKCQHIDMSSYLPENILVKTDRTSMLNSLETRVPLLDYQVLELAATLPRNMKFRGQEQKYALRAILQKYVPQEILAHKKTGFGVPLKYWFEREWKDHTRDLLLDPQSFCARYMEVEQLRALVENHSAKRDYSRILYRLLILEEWSRLYAG